jgi:hypothetical protein
MPWSTSRPASAARGYGSDHTKARAVYMAQLQRDGVGVCCIGGEPIYPWMGRSLHLDHTPDRTGYRGLACATHNRQDGAKRGRARQTASRLRW